MTHEEFLARLRALAQLRVSMHEGVKAILPGMDDTRIFKATASMFSEMWWDFSSTYPSHAKVEDIARIAKDYGLTNSCSWQFLSSRPIEPYDGDWSEFGIRAPKNARRSPEFEDGLTFYIRKAEGQKVDKIRVSWRRYIEIIWRDPIGEETVLSNFLKSDVPVQCPLFLVRGKGIEPLTSRSPVSRLRVLCR